MWKYSRSPIQLFQTFSNKFLTLDKILLEGINVQCQGIPFCLFFQMGKAVENKSRVLIGHKNHPIISLRSSPLFLTSPMPNSFVLHLQRTDEFETCHLKLGMCWTADKLTKRPRSQKVSTHILLKFLWRNLHQAYISVHSRYEIRVSVQGVKSLGGHFARLCHGFDFNEVKKKREILLHF